MKIDKLMDWDGWEFPKTEYNASALERPSSSIRRRMDVNNDNDDEMK